MTPLFIIAAGLWLGAIVFHSAVVAPTVFPTVGPEKAGVFLRALFPRFYVFGLACATAMLLALVFTAVTYGTSRRWALLLSLTVAMALANLVSLWLTPRINAARDASDDARFRRLHGVSVGLTLLVLVLGLVALVLAAGAPLAGG